MGALVTHIVGTIVPLWKRVSRSNLREFEYDWLGVCVAYFPDASSFSGWKDGKKPEKNAAEEGNKRGKFPIR